ncbi:putative secreted protein [Sorangium cellulosum So ce56]|uniref:Secreted protein n=2 Tax=Sorangium cellulosum TaxID=56 RepID=A9G0H1_SORC5|nr:putative secreted protein [Sorangium cellulosum So ce56]
MLAAAALLAASCARPPSERSDGSVGAIAALVDEESAPAIGAPTALSPADARPAADARPPAEQRSPPASSAWTAGEARVARALQRSPLRALRLTGKLADGRFEATLSLSAPAEGAAPREVKVKLAPAQKKAPLAFRRPLAFYRMARALGAHVVPAAAARRIGIGELAALIGREPNARKLLRRLAVMNDGTVDALVLAPAPGPPGPRWLSPRRRSVRFDDAPELDVWARWARSPSPVRGERTVILRDYLEVLVLDYLAGNGLRKEIVIDVHAGALSLEANASAFPLHVKAHELDRQLERLVEAARFPRALRDALARFGPEEAAAALRPGGIEEELVPPRALVELEERRQALLSLIAAKLADRGEDAVLSL